MAKPSRKDRKIAKMRLVRSPMVVPSKAPEERVIPPAPPSGVRLVEETPPVPALEPEIATTTPMQILSTDVDNVSMLMRGDPFEEERLDPSRSIDRTLRSLVFGGIIPRDDICLLMTYVSVVKFQTSKVWNLEARDALVSAARNDEGAWTRFRIRMKRTGLLDELTQRAPRRLSHVNVCSRDTRAA
ncbi:MAG: hypothetical protein WC787_03305 [Patescibacteria group bacterium]|jgi:hypothetical protein